MSNLDIVKSIGEIDLKIMNNERLINGLVDESIELRVIREGLRRELSNENKKGVKEGREKGRGANKRRGRKS